MLRRMCRNIRVLLNFEPPTTDEEIRAAALQYVRKVSGTQKPAQVNQEKFEQAVAGVFAVTKELLESMEVRGEPRTREAEKAKAVARAQKRFGPKAKGPAARS